MTVKELIELDNLIGDITITVRGGVSGGQRLKEYHIGQKEGEEPLYHDDKDVYKQVAINAKDVGKDYYQILLNKIPKQWLGLTVTSYRVWKAVRQPYGVQHSFEHILIDVKPDEHAKEAIEAAEKGRNKMQRLTYKNPDGTFGLNNGYDMHKVPAELMGAIWKLKQYEETDLEPERIEEINDFFNTQTAKILAELQKYKELGLTLEQLKEIDKLYLEKCEEVNRIKAELGGLKEQVLKEKENMQNEIFEKIIEKLESKAHNYYPTIDNYCVSEKATKLSDAKEIVRQVASEYNNGWIPCSERLPNKEEYLENDGRFIVTDGYRRYQGLFDIYNDKLMTIQRRYRQNWSSPTEDKCVIAWQPLPEPYQSKEIFTGF